MFVYFFNDRSQTLSRCLINCTIFCAMLTPFNFSPFYTQHLFVRWLIICLVVKRHNTLHRLPFCSFQHCLTAPNKKRKIIEKNSQPQTFTVSIFCALFCAFQWNYPLHEEKYTSFKRKSQIARRNVELKIHLC